MRPDKLPDLFLDRSVGAVQVPAILRAAGLIVQTLAERYGKPEDERVSDIEWISDATADGMVCLMKDKTIARNPAERAALREARARAFCIANQNLRAPEMAGRILAALSDMEKACMLEAPFLFSIERGKIRRVDLWT